MDQIGRRLYVWSKSCSSIKIHVRKDRKKERFGCCVVTHHAKWKVKIVSVLLD